MKWQWANFDQLSNRELYEILKLRSRVFNVEQKCDYQDVDGYDLNAWHLCGWDESVPSLTASAYLRFLKPGVKYKEASIGRVVNSPETRGTGAGKKLMTEALIRIQKEFGDIPLRISAQAYLEKFYSGFGFVKVSEAYLEDNIPHVEMLRASLLSK